LFGFVLINSPALLIYSALLVYLSVGSIYHLLLHYLINLSNQLTKTSSTSHHSHLTTSSPHHLAISTSPSSLPPFFFISQSPSHFIKLSLYRFMGLNTYIGRVMIQVLTPSFSSSDFSISSSHHLIISLSLHLPISLTSLPHLFHTHPCITHSQAIIDLDTCYLNDWEAGLGPGRVSGKKGGRKGGKWKI